MRGRGGGRRGGRGRRAKKGKRNKKLTSRARIPAADSLRLARLRAFGGHATPSDFSSHRERGVAVERRVLGRERGER